MTVAPRWSISAMVVGAWLAAAGVAARAAPTPPPAPAPPAPPTPDDKCMAKAKLAYEEMAEGAIAKHEVGCDALARILWTLLGDKFQAQINVAKSPNTRTIPLSAVQPKDNDSKGGQGSPAQVAAVPSVQPVATVGGSVSMAGTTTGATVVSAIAVNPVTLFNVPDPDPSKSRTYAEYSRFADVSLILPANVSSTLASGDVSFVGIRARVNLTGVHEGDKAYDAVAAAQGLLENTYNGYRAQIGPLLRAAPNVEACADAILAQDGAAMTASCGAALTVSNAAAVAIDKAVTDLAQAADREYLGLDLRADFGDPTFSGDPMAGGTYILAALAGGLQVSPNFAVRARGGVAYTKLTKDASATYGVDYGAAVEISGGGPQQRVRISVGIEGRTGNADPLADQHFLNLKLGLSVPVADGKTLGIGLTKPVAFEDHASVTRSTLLTITGDLGLLLPAVQH